MYISHKHSPLPSNSLLLFTGLDRNLYSKMTLILSICPTSHKMVTSYTSFFSGIHEEGVNSLWSTIHLVYICILSKANGIVVTQVSCGAVSALKTDVQYFVFADFDVMLSQDGSEPLPPLQGREK